MSIENLETVAGLNIKNGLMNCMDDEDLYLSIVSMYIEQVHEYLPLLSNHYQNKDWEEYGNLAHSIKGASASVGTYAIQELSRVLEQAAKEQTYELIDNKHDDYTELLTSTIKSLESSL